MLNNQVIGYTLIWGDTLNYLMYDSSTTWIRNNTTETNYWRNAEISNQMIEFYNARILDVDNDSRVVIFKADYDEIEYNYYEKRVFCDRIVELYYMDSVKVYSAFTEKTCPVKTERQYNQSIPDSLIVPVG